MDTQSLVAGIEAEIEKEDRLPDEKIFLRLLKEVWQVDWMVAPLDVWAHMLEGDIPYFLNFMGYNQENEEVEPQLIQDWIAVGPHFQVNNTDQNRKERVLTLINDVNELRIAASQKR